MQSIDDKGKIIGEFDLEEYNLPTQKAYLLHQVVKKDKHSENREYLRIIGITTDNRIIQYGYVYYMLHISKEGLPISKYIGTGVSENHRGQGIGDLLMSIYLYYSYNQGFPLMESCTRQRKLDILSVMNKYGFRVKQPERYEYGEKDSLFKNNMVIDIYRNNRGEIYYKFKTKKAEQLYRKNNSKISGNYFYLNPDLSEDETKSYRKLGWIVPNEEYERRNQEKSLMVKHLEKSRFKK